MCNTQPNNRNSLQETIVCSRQSVKKGSAVSALPPFFFLTGMHTINKHIKCLSSHLCDSIHTIKAHTAETDNRCHKPFFACQLPWVGPDSAAYCVGQQSVSAPSPGALEENRNAHLVHLLLLLPWQLNANVLAGCLSA